MILFDFPVIFEFRSRFEYVFVSCKYFEHFEKHCINSDVGNLFLPVIRP